jgi:two-component system alkaline phosphatase synthesis response regulator PhoP
MRVLIVDDDPDCRQIIALMLSKQGWTLAFAGDGREALAAAREFGPDLVLMDLLMPGMTGLEAARAMREDDRLRDAAMVAVTALAFESDRMQAFVAGFDAVVTKPFGRRQLLDTIGRLFPDRPMALPTRVPA